MSASWYRSCELVSLHYEAGSVVLGLTDEDGRKWRLTFTTPQACKVTTEECDAEIIERLPKGGGIFVTEDSDWLVSLGKGHAHFLEKSRHFVVPCYDEIVEVVAWDLNCGAAHEG